MAYHNLLRHNEMSPGKLLGHGLNFCFKPASTNNMIHHTFNHLEKYIRRFWALRGSDDNDDYNPAIYLKSDYEFKPALIHIEQALKAFKKKESNKNSYNFNDSAFESPNVICLH